MTRNNPPGRPARPYVFLALAVIDIAARDYRRGDSSARAWLQETGALWIDLAGVDISPEAFQKWLSAGCPNRRSHKKNRVNLDTIQADSALE